MEPVPVTVLGPRDVVVVEGPDAATYLQSQVAQDLGPVAVGDAVWSFVLGPDGKIVVLARVVRAGDERFELDTDAGFGETLLARLARFKIRVRAELTLRAAAPDEPARDERARIAVGWPAMGRELVPGETLPAATGLTALAVSFTKGCYPGQELVERMDSRGAEAPRSLRRLQVPDGTAEGDEVWDGADVVGVITSVAGTSALGYVRRGSDVGEPVAFG
jgi:folate-binding protein YgfZ